MTPTVRRKLLWVMPLNSGVTTQKAHRSSHRALLFLGNECLALLLCCDEVVGLRRVVCDILVGLLFHSSGIADRSVVYFAGRLAISDCRVANAVEAPERRLSLANCRACVLACEAAVLWWLTIRKKIYRRHACRDIPRATFATP